MKLKKDKVSKEEIGLYFKDLKKRRGSGFKKIESYYEELVRSKFLEKKCNFIRLMSQIPESGYKYKNKPADGDIHWMYPVAIPKKWAGYRDNNLGIRVATYIYQLQEELQLAGPVWQIIITNCLFFDRLPNPQFLKITSLDLCGVGDAKKRFYSYLDALESNDQDLINRVGLEMEEELRFFPVSLKISPYASKRDILDFIGRNFDHIKNLQDEYRKPHVELGKIKKKGKKTSDRNDFIYKIHWNKPLKDVANEVYKKFNQHLDVGHIGKIISLETERRAYLAGKRDKDTKKEFMRILSKGKKV